MTNRGQNGFTLLELLLVITVLLVIVTIGQDYYSNYVRSIELEAEARLIASDLKTQRGKASSGLDDRHWGVRFVNDSSDYYVLFSTPDTYSSASTTVSATTTLPNGVSFTSPGEGSSSTVMFTKVFGTTTAATITLNSWDVARSVSVSANGLVN